MENNCIQVRTTPGYLCLDRHYSAGGADRVFFFVLLSMSWILFGDLFEPTLIATIYLQKWYSFDKRSSK